MLRAQGYKLTMKDIPFQAAKASTSIASDVRLHSLNVHTFMGKNSSDKLMHLYIHKQSCCQVCAKQHILDVHIHPYSLCSSS